MTDEEFRKAYYQQITTPEWRLDLLHRTAAAARTYTKLEKEENATPGQRFVAFWLLRMHVEALEFVTPEEAFRHLDSEMKRMRSGAREG